jgi:cytochrome c oxidase cbb3-type subunit 4
MDIGTWRGLVTATLIVLFLALIVWAWSKARKPEFERAARAALEEDPSLRGATDRSTREPLPREPQR